MAVNNYVNGYQPVTGFQGNNYGNNYNGYTNTTTPINAVPISPPPANIGFVQGKMGASTFPVMSSNTTVYLFDVQDQTKFYVKSTDAFGMTMPLREFKYEEVVQPQTAQPVFPAPRGSDIDETKEVPEVTKEDFEELKAQVSAILQRQQNKPRKERTNNAKPYDE